MTEKEHDEMMQEAEAEALANDYYDEGDWEEEWMADGDLLFHPCGPSGGRC